MSQDSMVIGVNRSAKVIATVRYVDGSTDGNVSLSSDDRTVVAVNSATGEINGLKPGTATVRVSAWNHLSTFVLVLVTVREGDVEGMFATITPEKANVAVRSLVQLSAEVQDGNGKFPTPGSWTTSNPQVALVNRQGIVTGLKEGVVTITFTPELNSAVKATAEVTVGNPPQATPTPTPGPEQNTEQNTVATSAAAVTPQQ